MVAMVYKPVGRYRFCCPGRLHPSQCVKSHKHNMLFLRMLSCLATDGEFVALSPTENFPLITPGTPAWHAGPGRERSWVLLGELARHEPGAGTDAAPAVLRVVVPLHGATAAALGLGGEQLGIDAGGLAERTASKSAL